MTYRRRRSSSRSWVAVLVVAVLVVAVVLLAVPMISRYPWIIPIAFLALVTWISWWVGTRVYRWRRRVALREEDEDVLRWYWADVRASGIAEIDRWLTEFGPRRAGHRFEDRLEVLFQDLGCEVENIGDGGGDFGTDLIVSWGHSVGEGMALKVKLDDWRNRHYVGNDAVMQALAGAYHHGISKACVVTNSRFTPAAHAQARSCGVRLIERDELVSLLIRAEKTPASGRSRTQETPESEIPKTEDAEAPERARTEGAPNRDREGLYRTLQLDPSAEAEVIEVAWRRLAQIYHPDGARPDLARMQAINRAHDVLKDPQQRAEYDRSGTWA